jgi:hypothetical protein
MLRSLLSIIIALAVVLTIIVAIPFALIATAFWAADGSWDFEGRGFKYWMFVQGSRLERLGTIEPRGAVKYSISLQEGNFPGWNIATYESAALPDKIIAAYGERCREMKLKIIESKRDPRRSEMTCEIEVYLNVEILAEREAGAAVSKVFVKVWGSE